MKPELFNRFRKAVIQELESQSEPCENGLQIDFMDARGLVINQVINETPEHEREGVVAALESLEWKDLDVNLPLDFLCADDEL
jgi:hypothetical protein